MLYSIESVKPLENYMLLLTFNTGEQKVYDMKPFLHSPVFKPLNDTDLFRKAHIVYDYTVGWTDGIDICPDCAYRDSMAYVS